MEILFDKYLGFCPGVKKAIKIARKAGANKKESFIFGPLVHNERVNESLKKLGIKTIDSIERIKEGVFIIPAHGARPEVLKRAKEKGLEIIDATCPIVKKVQKIARDFSKKGWQVIILGDRGHREVEGILGKANGKAIVVQDLNEAKNLKMKRAKKIVFLSQTTQEKGEFDKAFQILKKKFKRAKRINTICPAISLRQESARVLAKKSDLVLIIGSKTSANTKRLKEIIQKIERSVHLVFSIEDLRPNWFKNKQKIGIASGASTPFEQVKEIGEKIKNLYQ